jgi:hypothetical protein
MKIIYCMSCGDLFRLEFEKKDCKCGRSSGQYTTSEMAKFSGDALPIGIANPDLETAARRFPRKTTGIRAWVDGPVECTSWERDQ